jgi:ketosteroid isomerase-like protein
VSQQNVEKLRHAMERFNDGDFSTGLALNDPDVMLRVGDSYAIPGMFVGAASVERRFAEFFTAFGPGFQIEILEAIESGDSVIIVFKQAGRGHLSGAAVENLATAVFTFRGGRIIRMDFMDTRQEALKAVGLEE